MIKDSNNHQGEKVAINGFVKSIYVYNKSSIVIIEQSSSIQGLMFDKIDMNLVNRSVTVYGKIQDEKIIIDKIIQK
ncbi:TPA: hypothetical protein HA235_04735 [Candidatus Woesearchaeota archaeon]|nr:hypothetical protein [Candidatus Woesearchaeota archaeon]HIJ14767.1 hypothetical protein [Candidatus Woesearchaeota archaeon]